MRILIMDWRAETDELEDDDLLRETLETWAGGNDVTIVATSPGDHEVDTVAGFPIRRSMAPLDDYDQARRWWLENGRGNYDVVLPLGWPLEQRSAERRSERRTVAPPRTGGRYSAPQRTVA